MLLGRLDELARTATAEVGKPLPEAYLHEAFASLDSLAWLEAEAEAVLAPEQVPPGVPYLLHKRIELLHEPCGVVAVVAPWNFPFAIPFVQAATAVAAGNAVVVKPSELTPLTGALIEDCLPCRRRAGRARPRGAGRRATSALRSSAPAGSGRSCSRARSPRAARSRPPPPSG